MSPPWLRRVAAAQAAAIVALGVALGIVLWQRPPAAAYRTVTDPPARAISGPIVKAIFDDQVRVADVREILSSAGLVAVAGPSEAGVYTLVAIDARSRPLTSATLDTLHADPRVRFAEFGAQ